MGYRTRPRYQAKTLHSPRAAERQRVAALTPPWEPGPVLDALNEMHNAPQKPSPRERTVREREARHG